MIRNSSTPLKRIAIGTSLLAGLFAAMSAHALPAITTWSASVNSGFQSWTWENGVTPTDSSDINPVLNMPSTLSWGRNWNAPYTPSSISVSGGTNGQWAGNLNTGAAPVQTVEFSHTNMPVTGAYLKQATLFDVITLQPISPFAGTCASASAIPCRDIFTLDITGTGLTIGADYSLNQLIKLTASPDDWYNVKLQLDGFGLLTNAECAAAGAATGCLGFTTEENQVTTKGASLSIQKVPEPGMLGLLGASLLGFVATRRRKQQ